MVKALGTMKLPSTFDTHDTVVTGMEIWVDIYIHGVLICYLNYFKLGLFVVYA